MKYEIDVEIDLPRERVVELFDSPENMKHWQPGLVSHKLLSGEAGRPGARTELVQKMGSRTITMVETVVSRDLPDSFAVTYEAPKVWNRMVSMFEEITPNRTRWRAGNEFRCSGFIALLAWLNPGAFKKETPEVNGAVQGVCRTEPKPVTVAGTGKLQLELAACDAASAAELKKIYARHKWDSNFLECALNAFDNPHAEVAATWMVKRHLENGAVPDAGQQAKMLAMLEKAEAWQARLHVLQCLPFLRIPGKLSRTMFRTLMELIRDRNKFVRAWAYNGLHVLGCQHSQYHERCMAKLALARDSEAPSVRARIRNILK